MRLKLSKKSLAGELRARVQELSEQNLLACYQCGKCAAGCPSVEAMDVLPSQVMRLVQLGQVEEALETKTIWVCAACQTCKVRCPRGVDLACVMEALRQIVLREKGPHVHPGAIPQSDLEGLPQIALIGGFRKFTH